MAKRYCFHPYHSHNTYTGDYSSLRSTAVIAWCQIGKRLGSVPMEHNQLFYGRSEFFLSSIVDLLSRYHNARFEDADREVNSNITAVMLLPNFVLFFAWLMYSLVVQSWYHHPVHQNYYPFAVVILSWYLPSPMLCVSCTKYFMCVTLSFNVLLMCNILRWNDADISLTCILQSCWSLIPPCHNEKQAVYLLWLSVWQVDKCQTEQNITHTHTHSPQGCWASKCARVFMQLHLWLSASPVGL